MWINRHQRKMDIWQNDNARTERLQILRNISLRTSRLGGRRFEPHQRQNLLWVFSVRGRLLPRVECAMGSNGKIGTTQSRFIHFTDALLRVLLKFPDQHCRCLYFSGPVDAGIYYERKRRVQPCHVVSDRKGTP